MLTTVQPSNFDPVRSSQLFQESKDCLTEIDKTFKQNHSDDIARFERCYLLICQAIETAEKAEHYSKNKSFYQNHYNYIAEKIFYVFSMMHKVIFQGPLKKNYTEAMKFFNLIESSAKWIAAFDSDVRKIQNYSIYSSLFLLFSHFLNQEKKDVTHSILDILEKCQYVLKIAKNNCFKKNQLDNLANWITKFFYRDLARYLTFALEEINSNKALSAVEKLNVLDRFYNISRELNNIYYFIHNKNYIVILSILQSKEANLPRLETIVEISDLERFQKLLELKIRYWHLIKEQGGHAIIGHLYSYHHLFSVVYEKLGWLAKKGSNERLMYLVKAGENCEKTIKFIEDQSVKDLLPFLIEEKRKLVRYCIDYNVAKHQNPDIKIDSNYPISTEQAIDILKELAQYHSLDITSIVSQENIPFFLMRSLYDLISKKNSNKEIGQKDVQPLYIGAMQLFIKEEYTRFGPSYKPSAQMLEDWDEVCKANLPKVGKD